MTEYLTSGNGLQFICLGVVIGFAIATFCELVKRHRSAKNRGDTSRRD